jgi:hypothetical protein
VTGLSIRPKAQISIDIYVKIIYAFPKCPKRIINTVVLEENVYFSPGLGQDPGLLMISSTSEKKSEILKHR